MRWITPLHRLPIISFTLAYDEIWYLRAGFAQFWKSWKIDQFLVNPENI
jgi:hypothetical protein